MRRSRYLLLLLAAAPLGLLCGALLTTQFAGGTRAGRPPGAPGPTSGNDARSTAAALGLGANRETPTPAATRYRPAPPTAAQNAAFTRAVYLDLTGGEPAATDLARWTRALTGGGERTALVGEVLRSAARQEHDLNAVYVQLLDRPADAMALSGWADLLASSRPIARLEAAIAASAEYANRHGDADTAWLPAAYADLLGRPPTATELDLYLAALQTDATRADIATALLASAEGRQRFVAGLFQQYLGRAATPDELAWLSAAPADGWSEATVRADLLVSDEYFARRSQP